MLKKIETNIVNNYFLELDVLRIIACFAVILNHTGATSRENQSLLYLMFVSLHKVNTPLFAAISGALLLSKTDTWKQLLSRIFRIIVVLFVVSNGFMIYVQLSSGSIDIINILKNSLSFINTPVLLTYWYLYMYIGILIMLPFLRRMARNMTLSEYKYYFIILFVFFLIQPIIVNSTSLSSISPFLILPIVMPDLNGTPNFLAYFFLGHFLKNIVPKEFYNKKGLIFAILIFISTLLMFPVSYYAHLRGDTPIDIFSTSNITLPSFLMVVSVWYIVTIILKNVKISSKLEVVLKEISASTFGIYLIHNYILTETNFINKMLYQWCPNLIAEILYLMVVFISSFAIVVFLRRIPLIKKYI